MPTADQYRKNAQDSRQNAAESIDGDERDTLLRIAAPWDRLADRKTRKAEGSQRN
jgi:hypothetical protein